MKASFFKPAALAALIAISLSACTKPCDGGNELEGCNSNTMCTTELRAITISIKDSAGHPVALDEYKTVRLRNSTSFALQEDAATEQERKRRGEYPVSGDNLMRHTKKDGEQFDFYGYKGGKQVIKRTYNIGHDCCHIQEKGSNSQQVIVQVPN